MKEQNNVDNTITTIEMCAGYGGIGLGIKRIFGERLRTIAYCELEGFAQANLISKMEAGLLDAAPLWNDLKTFPYAEFHGLVDILIAGYPCQPFSAAGKRAGKDDPRHLWPWIADGIRLLRPRMCFFENVEGHISLGLSTVISDLEELGYKVSWGIFSASEVGAPHQRKRVFIMAYAAGFGGRENNWIGNAGLANQADEVWPSRPGELADAELHGFSGRRIDGKRNFCGSSSGFTQSSAAWPSRPGEPQYGWEPPRVVDASSARQQAQRDKPVTKRQEGLAGESGGGDAQGLAHAGSLGRRRGSDGDEGGLCGEIQATGSCGGGAEAGMAHTHSCGGEEPEHQQANLPSEPSGGNAEAVGNASSARLERGRQPTATRTSTNSTSTAGGNWQVEQSMGLHSNGTSDGLGHAELSSLCDSELAEIREWMVKCDNRTDELRLLGNGVLPATAERAFRTLMEELQK